ncbi:phosphoribosylglycinamide formyltransferase [candidate division WOR-3 bacterium JGI_Cruoil_03_51_56]|uniref:Phosphoribosylglycinamide formyltransferase n=1 Tax=candidate division WOR-3 bacterium JGI_Cruoil_03_51_56 TaxID=1973747 RepID=A0A235BUR6_UNCW3|nr:MAG: phosphoribosylglycinamide formyltransferase [candidate division WOR-3 bacterium JGI_Cruoil_03_51_56]
MSQLSVGVLVSGRGTNFEALVRTIKREAIDAQVKIVISNIPDALALKRAEILNIPSLVISHRDFKSRASFEQTMIRELTRYDVRLVCLAGFMRILSPVFHKHYQNQIMNIHPSLLPAFAGLQGIQVHRAVIESGVKITGCTVHFVTENVDAGPIIIQRAIPVRENDTPESLAVRVLLEEHQAYPEAVRLFSENRLKIEGRHVRILDI